MLLVVVVAGLTVEELLLAAVVKLLELLRVDVIDVVSAPVIVTFAVAVPVLDVVATNSEGVVAMDVVVPEEVLLELVLASGIAADAENVVIVNVVVAASVLVVFGIMVVTMALTVLVVVNAVLLNLEVVLPVFVLVEIVVVLVLPVVVVFVHLGPNPAKPMCESLQ